jgi:hypothetical protein
MNLLKWAERQPNKKSQFALSQGMMKRCDVEDDAHDEMRTTVKSQVRVIATLSTEEPFIRAQHL